VHENNCLQDISSKYTPIFQNKMKIFWHCEKCDTRVINVDKRTAMQAAFRASAYRSRGFARHARQQKKAAPFHIHACLAANFDGQEFLSQ
jgi:UDP-N-acetylmuramyl pentapeptide synthase